jgi:DNA-binding FadR family transcriptional regulator
MNMAINLESELLNYLIEQGCEPGRQLPSIEELAKELRVSVSKLREQLEVARFLGLIEVKPRRGMRTLGFSLLPSLRIALRLAMALDPTNFEFFGVLRNHVEAGFWYEAVRTLQPSDKQYLSMLVQDALKQLRGNPVQIPHKEHRDFHLTIFSRLENPFVYAILEAYWDAYEQIGLNVYTDYQYLEEIWDYHKQIAVSIREGDYERGYQALVEHTGALLHRPEIDLFRPKMVLEDSGDTQLEAQWSEFE